MRSLPRRSDDEPAKTAAPAGGGGKKDKKKGEVKEEKKEERKGGAQKGGKKKQDQDSDDEPPAKPGECVRQRCLAFAECCIAEQSFNDTKAHQGIRRECGCVARWKGKMHTANALNSHTMFKAH
jgi:hypothetical protein